MLVHNRGSAFERYLIQRIPSLGPQQEIFSFLTQQYTSENLFYRWCLLVLGNEETFASYSLLPFQFVVNGKYFIPPPPYEEKRHENKRKEEEEENTRRRKREREKEEEEMVAKRRKEQG